MKDKKNYYITTPIYYASGRLTVGHCFSTVLADICARFYRLNGYKVFYATGSDEHGLKIAKVASENNELRLYDRVIVKGKKLYDGKIRVQSRA